MTFQHIFSSGSVAILKVHNVPLAEATHDICCYFSALGQDERFSDQELEEWFDHILDWCMENLEWD